MPHFKGDREFEKNLFFWPSSFWTSLPLLYMAQYYQEHMLQTPRSRNPPPEQLSLQKTLARKAPRWRHVET